MRKIKIKAKKIEIGDHIKIMGHLYKIMIIHQEKETKLVHLFASPIDDPTIKISIKSPWSHKVTIYS